MKRTTKQSRSMLNDRILDGILNEIASSHSLLAMTEFWGILEFLRQILEFLR